MRARAAARPALLSLVVVAATAVLAGCATANLPAAPDSVVDTAEKTRDETLTLATAKADAIALADEIASYIPPERVAESSRIESARTLLSCRGEDRYGWPGRTTLVFDGAVEQVDQPALLEPIVRAWSSREGWTVKELTNEASSSVDLKSADGATVRASFMLSGTEFWVDVVSPCFALPGGFVYGTDY